MQAHQIVDHLQLLIRIDFEMGIIQLGRQNRGTHEKRAAGRAKPYA